MAPAVNGRGPPDFNFLLLPRTLCLYLYVRIRCFHLPLRLFVSPTFTTRPSYLATHILSHFYQFSTNKLLPSANVFDILLLHI